MVIGLVVAFPGRAVPSALGPSRAGGKAAGKRGESSTTLMAAPALSETETLWNNLYLFIYLLKGNVCPASPAEAAASCRSCGRLGTLGPSFLGVSGVCCVSGPCPSEGPAATACSVSSGVSSCPLVSWQRVLLPSLLLPVLAPHGSPLGPSGWVQLAVPPTKDGS